MKAIILIILIALTHQTISLGHVLIDHASRAAIVIVRGDREGHCRRQLRRQKWRALHRLARLLLRRKMLSRHRIFYMEGAQGLSEAIYTRSINEGRP